jgi:four helix bundle protein
MSATDLRQRTKKFALEVIAFVEALPRDETSRVLGRQLLRSGTSVGANYRSAKRGRSNADFISRMGIVEEEADECGYWLELLTESGKVPAAKSAALNKEAGELVAIAVASINTARGTTRNAERGARKEPRSEP